MEQSAAERVRGIVEKVRAFKRLTVPEAAKLLSICELKQYTKRETIYEVGDPSDEMLVLVQGQLITTSETGSVLGRILPGETVGEMGVLTGETRSANVVAEEASAGFTIKKKALQGLFLGDEKIKLKVYENLVGILCDRLSDANKRIETLTTKE